MRPKWYRFVAAVACACVTVPIASAQPCVEGWIASNPWIDDVSVPTIRDVNAIARWDPDGPGPKHELIVVGGRFVTPGAYPISGIAAWDPVARHWLRLGGGVDTSGVMAEGAIGSGVVYALAAMPDGRLFAGGVFTQIGDLVTNNIAQYDGGMWKPFKQGTETGESNAVRSFLPMPDGTIIVGGAFSALRFASTTALTSVNGVARWNGVEWSRIGMGLGRMTNASVLALMRDSDTGFFAAGSFTAPFRRMARWDGAAFNWVADINGPVTSIARGPGGDLVVAGEFTTIDGGTIHKLTVNAGSEWSSVPSSLAVPIARARVLGNLADSSVLVSVNDTMLARWNGTRLDEWDDAPPLATPKAMLTLPNGGVWLGNAGTRVNPSDAEFNGLAVLNGDTWRPLQDVATLAPNGLIEAILPAADGTFLVCGQFTAAGGQPCNIATYDGAAWRALATLDLPINAACKGPGTSFIIAGTKLGTSTSNVYRIENGVTTPLGSGTDGPIYAIDVLPDGDVVVGGRFATAGNVIAPNLARWDGAAWASLPPGTNGVVYSIKALPNGDVIVGGSFDVVGANFAGRGVMRLRNGAAFPMGTGLGPTAIIQTLQTSSTGAIYAAGLMSKVSGDKFDGIARWNGESWEAVTSNSVPVGLTNAIAFDQQGRLLLGGRFTTNQGKPAAGLLRLDGNVWRDVGAGVNAMVNAIAVSPTLGVLAGGSLTFNTDIATPFFARFACRMPVCPLDFDTDGELSTADFAAFVDKFNNGDPATDINQDRTLSFEDFDAFVAGFAEGCEAA